MENAEQQHLELNEPIAALRIQLGEHLQRERLSQQKEVVDVARRLMLSKLQLLAVESGQSENFHHERRYLQAIKSYVFYLNLENNPSVMDLLRQIEGVSAAALNASPAAAVAQLHGLAAPTRDRGYASRRPKFVYYAIGLVVAGAVALVTLEGWPLLGDDQEHISAAPSTEKLDAPPVRSNASTEVVVRPVPVPPLTASAEVSPPRADAPALNLAPVSTPVAGLTQAEKTPKADVPKISSGPARMRIEFSGDCWVSLQTTDGKKDERIYKQGQHLEVPVASVASLILGNAPAASVTFQGRQVDIMKNGFTQGNVTRLNQASFQLLQKN
jgi:hypothetical protein